MKKVIIKVGGYGYRPDKKAAVKLITEKDGPISVSDEEAERLLALKVAVLADEPEAEEPEMAIGHLDAESLQDYTVPQLKDLAKDLGLKTTGTKEELIERISAEQVQYPVADEAETETDEEPPVLEAADPE